MARIVRDDHHAFAFVTGSREEGWTLHATVQEGILHPVTRTIEVHRTYENGGDFTSADVDRILRMRDVEVQAGEKRRATRHHLAGPWWAYTHVNTGPPTWWLPRVRFERYGVMVGWLRGLVAVVVRRETRQCESCGTRGPVRYSPDHGANFCPPCHARENPSHGTV